MNRKSRVSRRFSEEPKESREPGCEDSIEGLRPEDWALDKRLYIEAVEWLEAKGVRRPVLFRKVLSVVLLIAFLPTLSCGGSEDSSAERYEELEIGQTVEFSSGIAVTLEAASVMTPPEPQTMVGPRGKAQSVSSDLAAQLRQEMREGNRLVNVRFSLENTNRIGTDPSRPLEAGQWEAHLPNSPPLEGAPLGGAMEASNPYPDYPYRGWQEELAPGKRRQGTIHFMVPNGTELRVRYTPGLQGADGASPLAEWDLGNVSKLSQDQV